MFSAWLKMKKDRMRYFPVKIPFFNKCPFFGGNMGDGVRDVSGKDKEDTKRRKS